MRSFEAVIGAFLLAGGAALAADLSAIDAYVLAEMELNEVPGAAVAIWRNGEIVYARGFGVRSLATAEPMTADTPLALASVSKSLTAVAVNRLIGQGKVDLGTPVTNYLPELGSRFKKIEIRHLIRHTSGLTRRDDYRVPCCGSREEYDLVLAATRLAIDRTSTPRPGEFVYANRNYVLLAAVVQRISGQSFSEFMSEFVFRPLRMSRTTLDAGEAGRMGVADPHEGRGRELQPGRSLFLGWYGSSLVKSTARDMARYLEWFLSSRGNGWY